MKDQIKLAKVIAGPAPDMTRLTRELANQFDETLKALRQKINDVELSTAKYFVAKGEFDDFRYEFREDMRDLKSKIDRNFESAKTRGEREK